MKMRNRILGTVAAIAVAATMSFGFTHAAKADGQAINIGVILGFTGPIESLTPDMAASAELAFKEASDSGILLGGKKIAPVRADSTCTDSAAATAGAGAAGRSEKCASA